MFAEEALVRYLGPWIPGKNHHPYVVNKRSDKETSTLSEHFWCRSNPVIIPAEDF